MKSGKLLGQVRSPSDELIYLFIYSWFCAVLISGYTVSLCQRKSFFPHSLSKDVWVIILGP